MLCTKNSLFLKRLFRKLAHSFVAIDFFFINRDFHFYWLIDLSVLGQKLFHLISKHGSYQKLFWVSIKISFSHFRLFHLFRRVVSSKNIWNIHKNWSFQIFFDLLIFFIYPHLSYFLFYHHFHNVKGHWLFIQKWSTKKYSIQQSRNLVYHHQLLMHHLNLIPHKHLSRRDLIISALLPNRTRTTHQLNITSSHV